uniref:Deleted in malignant brain tumors 1 protein-like n=1 Tax=Actinia tenebrosa TaxID=6105 RepID=A0A6P8HMV0_ACTTE
MEGKLILAPFLLLVLALVLEYKVTSADVCASSPILINSSTTGKFSSPNYPNNYPHNANKTWKIVAPIGQLLYLYYCIVNAILTAENGTITSPGYPEYYPHGLFYLWRITVPEGYVVQINFTTLITQHSASCTNAKSKCNCDYVHVLDGPCPFYNIGTKWCGAWTSRYVYPSYITTGRHMVLLFRSDLTNNHVGFVAHYRRALNCSGDKPISCVKNSQASCCVREASTCLSQTSIRSHCPRDGDPASFIGCCTVNGSPSCCPVLQSGNNISCPRSSDNHAFIDVCLNGGKQICCNRNLPACRYNTLLTDPNGVITSPGYPSSYPPNSLVVWRITVPEGFLVQINFTTLKIDKGFSCSSCNCDYVAVRDGPCSNIDGIKWCGSSWNRLPSFVSTGRHLQVVFKSDQWRSDDGFVARYRRALKCGGETSYSCLNNGEPACCKTQGASLVSTATKLWITMVIMTTALLLM